MTEQPECSPEAVQAVAEWLRGICEGPNGEATAMPSLMATVGDDGCVAIDLREPTP